MPTSKTKSKAATKKKPAKSVQRKTAAKAASKTPLQAASVMMSGEFLDAKIKELELTVENARKFAAEEMARADQEERKRIMAEEAFSALKTQFDRVVKVLDELLEAHESGWVDGYDWGAGERARTFMSEVKK